MDPVGIGLIGCGNISDAYLKAIAGFANLKVVGRAGIGVRRHSHSGTANSAPVAKRRKVTCVVP